jgi:hypothetical protein
VNARIVLVMVIALQGCDCGATPMVETDAAPPAEDRSMDAPFAAVDAPWPSSPCEVPVRHIYVDLPSSLDGAPIQAAVAGDGDRLWSVTGGDRGEISILLTELSTGETRTFAGPTHSAPARADPLVVRPTEDGAEALVHIEIPGVPESRELLWIRATTEGRVDARPIELPDGVEVSGSFTATDRGIVLLATDGLVGLPRHLVVVADGEPTVFPFTADPEGPFHRYTSTSLDDRVYFVAAQNHRIFVGEAVASGASPGDVHWTIVESGAGPDDVFALLGVAATPGGLVLTTSLQHSPEPPMLHLLWLDEELSAVRSTWSTEGGPGWAGDVAVFGSVPELGIALAVPYSSFRRVAVSYGRSPTPGMVGALRVITELKSTGGPSPFEPFGWELDSGAHAVGVRRYDIEVFVLCERGAT